MNEQPTKNKKIKLFYPVTQNIKPLQRKIRHYIHSQKSGGVWAYIRDLSQKERLANSAIGNDTVVKIIVGHNPKILQNWDKLIIVDNKGTTYRMKEKPDEFNYSKSDIKLTAYAFVNEDEYSGDEYE